MIDQEGPGGRGARREIRPRREGRRPRSAGRVGQREGGREGAVLSPQTHQAPSVTPGMGGRGQRVCPGMGRAHWAQPSPSPRKPGEGGGHRTPPAHPDPAIGCPPCLNPTDAAPISPGVAGSGLTLPSSRTCPPAQRGPTRACLDPTPLASCLQSQEVYNYKGGQIQDGQHT